RGCYSSWTRRGRSTMHDMARRASRLLPGLVLLGAAMLALAACAPGKPKRVFPPTASIQQLQVRADGSWDLLVRLQNFSNVGMRIERLELQLELNGALAARVDQQPGLVAPAGSAEVISVRVVA